jgi:hypothetical protein
MKYAIFPISAAREYFKAGTIWAKEKFSKIFFCLDKTQQRQITMPCIRLAAKKIIKNNRMSINPSQLGVQGTKKSRIMFRLPATRFGVL